MPWCRYNSCYFPESKSQKYIVIKNNIIAKILIAGGVGRAPIVNLSDRNKMSVIGLISYIAVLPTSLFYIAIRAMILFNYRGLDKDFMDLLSVGSLGILCILSVLGVLILLIRLFLWDHQNNNKSKLRKY